MLRYKFRKHVSILLMILLIGSFTTIGVLAADSIKLIVNGKQIDADVSPQIVDGRVMVPVRWVAEALDADVHWDAQNREVLIHNINLSPLQKHWSSMKPPTKEFSFEDASEQTILSYVQKLDEWLMDNLAYPHSGSFEPISEEDKAYLYQQLESHFAPSIIELYFNTMYAEGSGGYQPLEVGLVGFPWIHDEYNISIEPQEANTFHISIEALLYLPDDPDTVMMSAYLDIIAEETESGVHISEYSITRD